MKPKTYDIIIIGAGVAGLTAAIYATRANKSVLVLESKIPGGQIVQADAVYNWPGAKQISGTELTQNIYRQTQSLGAKFAFETVASVSLPSIPPTVKTSRATKTSPLSTSSAKTSRATTPPAKTFSLTTDETTYHAKALIIATGSTDKPLDLPKANSYLNHGLSYCATCDGALFKGQDVAVIGGGNTALYDTLYLANIARKVYLIHRRDTFRADAALVEKAKKLPNIEILTGLVPYSLKGTDRLTSIRLGPYIDPANPVKITFLPLDLDISGLFVAIGREPNTKFLKNLVDLDQNGYVVADESGKTSAPGIFAAGDCRTKSVRQLITASADGANATISAIDYLDQA